MTNSTSFKVEGLNDLLKNLQSLPQKVAIKAERKGLRAAMQPIKEAAEAKVPVKTGTLKASLKVRNRKRGSVPMVELVATDQKAHLLEYGHALKKGKYIQKIVGFVAARPFLRPALAENAEKAVEIFKENVEETLAEIEASAKK